MATENERQSPVEALCSLFSTMFKRPSSRRIHDYHIRFHWLLLALFPVAFAVAVLAGHFTVPFEKIPIKETSGVAFSIDAAFDGRAYVAEAGVAAGVMLLGVSVYQVNFDLTVAMAIALFPVLDQTIVRMLLIPSYAVLFVCLVMGIAPVWLSLHYAVSSWIWLIFSCVSSVLLSIAHTIRPEAMGVAAFLFVVFYARLGYSMLQKELVLKTVIDLIGESSQVAAVGGPFVVAGSLIFRNGTVTRYTMSEVSSFLAVGAESWPSWILFAVAFVCLYRMPRRFTDVMLAFALLIGAVVIIVVPMESMEAPVETKILLSKLLLVHFSSVVFGNTRVKRIRMFVFGSIGIVAVASYALNLKT